MSVRWFVGQVILPIQKFLPVTRLEHGAATRRFITSLKSRPWRKIPHELVGAESEQPKDSFFTEGIWPNGIIFHPARFPWNFREFPFLSYLLRWKLVWGRHNLPRYVLFSDSLFFVFLWLWSSGVFASWLVSVDEMAMILLRRLVLRMVSTIQFFGIWWSWKTVPCKDVLFIDRLRISRNTSCQKRNALLPRVAGIHKSMFTFQNKNLSRNI